MAESLQTLTIYSDPTRAGQVGAVRTPLSVTPSQKPPRTGNARNPDSQEHQAHDVHFNSGETEAVKGHHRLHSQADFRLELLVQVGNPDITQGNIAGHAPGEGGKVKLSQGGHYD